LLRRVTDRVKRAAKANSWPLRRIEIGPYQDPEATGWEYLVLTLVFDATFEAANRYLHQLYQHLDKFSCSLDERDPSLLRRLIYFDVAVAQHIAGSEPPVLSGTGD